MTLITLADLQERLEILQSQLLVAEGEFQDAFRDIEIYRTNRDNLRTRVDFFTSVVKKWQELEKD